MARLLSTVLLLAALAGSAAAASPRRIATQVASACEFVTVPQLCTNLAFKSGAATLGDLTKAAIDEALSSAQSARSVTQKALAAHSGDERLQKNLAVCDEAFSNAVASLQEAKQKQVAAVSDGKKHTEVTGAISAALVHVGSCNDAFSENPGLVSPVADATSIVKKLTSNCLSLAVAFQVKNGAY
ncbi:uncharacterized protein LOC141835815 [Curcuma longa]|uniref:uncharacterized protein LOC141835815 n=1 Tax=Curcuma longa TaxID=136217 RepID=UPI003D9F5ED0